MKPMMSTVHFSSKRSITYLFGALFIGLCVAVMVLNLVLPRGSRAAEAAALSSDHPMGCKPGEIFVDSQDWWMPTPGALGANGQPGKEFGHLHTAFCFPHKATVTGTMTLHIRSTMHHNPGKLRRLSIQIFAPKAAGAPNPCSDSSAVGCLEFNPPRTCPLDQTCRWEDDVTFNTADIAYDGLQEVRVHGIIVEPDGTQMHTSTGMHLYLKNGHPIKDYPVNPNIAMARGWYTNVNYTNASIVSPPTGPVSGVWTPEVRLESGSGGLPVTGWYAAVDTDFHNGNPGLPLCPGALIGTQEQPQCGPGPFRGRLRIDTTKLANGWHRLFLKADAISAATGSTNSGVLALLFEVKNG